MYLSPDPVFGFNPLMYDELEAVTIVEVNGLTFGPGVSRTLVINSHSSTTQPATGECTHAVVNFFEDLISSLPLYSPFPFKSGNLKVVGKMELSLLDQVKCNVLNAVFFFQLEVTLLPLPMLWWMLTPPHFHSTIL